MKKLDKSISKDFSPVVMYLEDLKDIERILREKGEDFQIKHADCLYDSVQELVDLIGSKEIKDVEIGSRNPYVSIGLKSTSTALYVSGGDTTLISGIFHQIEEVISRSNRRPRWIYKPSGAFILSILLIVIYEIFKAAGNAGYKTGGFLLVLWGILYIGGSWVTLFHHSLVRLYEKPSGFIIRNRDQLIIQTFTALIAAAGGYLLAIVQKWLFP